MGGGGFGGLPKDESDELADLFEEKKPDGVVIAPAHPEAPACRATMESEKKRKAGALKMEVDAEEEPQSLAQDDLARPKLDKAKDQRQLDALRGAMPEPFAPDAAELGFVPADKPGGMLGRDRRVWVRERYFGRQPVYADNLLWQPLLLTDANGQASIQFELPGVVTTYRVLVDGHVDGRIGSGEGKIISKPSQD